MGRAGLPSISKIEDVLDLLTDPEKYIRYLTEFKSVHDEVKASLGDLDTKAKADAYFERASDALAKSAVYVKSVKADAEKIASDVQAEKDRALVRAQEAAASIAGEHDRLSARAREIDSKYATCDAFVKGVAQEYDELKLKLAATDALRVRLEADSAVVSNMKAKLEIALTALGLKPLE